MHPIVAQMNPSPEQEPAILARGKDIVVTAGAGTGKTRTLVARYLSLLAEGLDLRSIVAITFTRKAAREMRNRVRDEVRRYLQRPDLDAMERQRWQDLFGGLDAARIDTIHGLCADILRSHPAEAAVDPRFAILEDGVSRLLQRRAVDEALGWAADDEQAATLFAALGERELRRTLEVLLGKRLDTLEALQRLPADLTGRWQSILGGELNERDEALARLLPPLQATWQFTLQRLEAFKSELDALDFDDLEGRALQLLRENETVRSHWRGVVQAILVDEFQDTNGRQRDLVALLNDGGKLFVVGDAKQSIYRFRGADVSVFRCERRRIEAKGGLHFPLQVSYRAHHQLLQGLNDLLRPVLGEQDDPTRPWVEPFSKLDPYRDEPAAGLAGPYIELQLALGTKSEGALDLAADVLAQRIAEWVASGVELETADGTRPLDYGDIAILCRASTSFPAYENALERAGIPYLTVAGGGFYERPEVRDLLNALQALADPTDDLALVGLLRSPAVGTTDAALFHLCQARAGAAGTPLWDVLRQGQAQHDLSAEDQARAWQAVQLIQELHESAGRTSVADLLKAFLDRTDYRAALVRAGDTRGARNVAKLLADAHTSGIVGVGEFLEYVAGLKASGAREGEARATAEGAVQIMTVHQAKGLEFPIVVIGDVTHERGDRDKTLLDPELGIVLELKDEQKQTPAVWDQAKARAQDQEDAESDRLFYVAATRAQEKLVLNGYVRLNKGDRIGAAKGWLGTIAGANVLHLQGKRVDCTPGGDGAIALKLQVGKTLVGCTLYEPGYRVEGGTRATPERAAGLVSMPPPLLQPLVAPQQQVDARVKERERIPVQRVWRVVPAAKRPQAPAWVIGSLVHEALAAWRFPDDYPATDMEHSFERWAEARARGYGLTDPDQLADAARRTAQLLARFRGHPLWAEMQGAEQRWHEVPYSIEVDGQVQSGILDALYRREGEWTLVEWKTDELHDEAGLLDLLHREDYVAQAGRYLDAAQRLLGQRPRLRLCLLNLAGAIRICDWDELQRLAAR